MTDKKDYSQLTLEELLAEEKKMKRQGITDAVFIGVLVGVIIYGVVKNGFGLLYTVLPLLLIAGVAKNGQAIKAKLQEVQGEIAGR
jgi:hypothetical protein